MELPGTTKPCMVNKGTVLVCHACNVKFKLFSKRNCETCGEVFCKECCQRNVPLFYKNFKDGKVCNDCNNEGFAYVHFLIIWLRCIGKIKINCEDCGKVLTFTTDKFGCLTCRQTICDRCIPWADVGKADVVPKCRRCQCQGNSRERKTIWRMEEDIKDLLINLISLVAESIDVHNKRINVAEVAFSAAGVVGGTLAITGFILSFVTFGASLGLSIAGGAVGGTSGLAQLSTRISRCLITKEIFDKIKQLCRCIQEVKENRWKGSGRWHRHTGVAGKLGSAIANVTETTIATESCASAIKSGVKLANSGDDVAAMTQAGATAGKLATKTATTSKTLFTSLGTGGRVLHFGGVVFAVVGLGIDVYTILDRSKKIHKNKPAEAAETMRRLAYRLMGPLPHLPSICERRVVERELDHQRALF